MVGRVLRERVALAERYYVAYVGCVAVAEILLSFQLAILKVQMDRAPNTLPSVPDLPWVG